MNQIELFIKFCNSNLSYAHEVFREVNKKYVGYEETMPKLKEEELRQIISIIHSCSYNNYNNIFLEASYICFMIATRQILENGNKRTAYLLLILYLWSNGFELDHEQLSYSQVILNMIKIYEEAGSAAKKEKLKIKLIAAFAAIVRENSMTLHKS